MGLNPENWGRQGWHFIHSVMVNYPDDPTEADKKKYKSFINSIPSVLPCPICGEHFKENLKKMPPDYASNESMWKWSVDVHNEVNKANKKPALSYDEAWGEFVKNSEKPNLSVIKKPNLNFEYFLLGVGACSLVALVFSGGGKK